MTEKLRGANCSINILRCLLPIAAVLLLAAVLVAPVAAAGSTEGICGESGAEDDVLWKLTGDESAYTLTLTLKDGIESAAMMNYTKTTLAAPWDWAREKITVISLPTGLTSLGDYAFNNTIIGDITIPNSVTYIGLCTFADCRELTGTLTIPKSVEEIGSACFARTGITGLEFEMGSQLKKFVTWGSFNGCSELTGTITIPKSVEEICPACFSGTRITGLEFEPGSQLKTIGTSAFFELNSLKGSISIPEGVETISQSTFSKTGISELILPSTINTINEQAFSECKSLERVVFISGNDDPSSILTIKGNAFLSCVRLELVTLPTHHGKIKYGSDAFKNAVNLSYISFPASSMTFTGGTSFYIPSDANKDMITYDMTAVTSIDKGHSSFEDESEDDPTKKPLRIFYFNNDELTSNIDGNGRFVFIILDGGSFEEKILADMKLIDPSKTGYAFGGWYTNKDLTDEVKDKTLTAGNTYYAKWDTITYSADTALDFGTIKYGETHAETVTITTNDPKPAFEVITTEKFKTSVEGKIITITPKDNLDVGEHTGTITIDPKYGDNIDITVTVTVEQATQTLTFAESVVSKSDKDAPFTNTLTQIGDGVVTYASSDPEVATIDENGKITILKYGTTTITANAPATTHYLVATEASYTLTVYTSEYAVIGEGIPAGGALVAKPTEQTKRDTLISSIEGTYANQFSGKTIFYVNISLITGIGTIDHRTQITFIVLYPAGINAENYMRYDFEVLHLNESTSTPFVELVPSGKVNAKDTGLEITSTLSSFAIGYSLKPVDNPSSSGSQGSSVWLMETQTPTPTATPTETPTDVAPTDFPSTQPTAEPSSPAPLLAVLAGLGAVAVLRRR